MANPAFTLESREKGQLPISIASSLAIESALGIMESDEPGYKPPASPPLLDYDAIWINLRTLFRNLHGSMNRVDADKVHINKFINALHTECLTIQAAITDAARGNCHVVFYAATHKSLGGFYSKAQFKENRTPIQHHYTAVEKNVIEGLWKVWQTTQDFVFENTDITLKNESTGKKLLLMTHIAVDLLAPAGFQEVTLLESHTGAIKKQKQWYTKLKGGEEMKRIPFDRATLQFFGDKGGMFIPYPKTYREVVLRCAEQNNWTQTTTKGRMLLTLELMRDPHVYIAFQSLY